MIAWLLFFGLQQGGRIQSDGVVLSVCELVGDLQSHTRRVVKIRGEFIAGPEEFFLEGEKCGSRIATGDYVWPNAVNLFLSPNPAVQELPLQPDARNIANFFNELRRAQAKNGAARGCATFVGLLQTWHDEPVVSVRPGIRPSRGFGHMGRLPAQLIANTVKEFHILPYNPALKCVCCISTPRR